MMRRLLGQPDRSSSVQPPPPPAPSPCAGIDWNERAIDEGFSLLERYRDEFLSFPAEPAGAGYGYSNPYFSLVDAAVAHCFVRSRRFSRVIEVGSGFSSRVLRGALDRNRHGHLTCIDPEPRSGVSGIAHEYHPTKVQAMPLEFFADLPDDSLVFIDSSHRASYGSDVTHLLLGVVPLLKPGVVVQVHDIFFPDEYPAAWHDWGYSEQYLLQALLTYTEAFSVLWPGRHVMRTRWAALQEYFPPDLIGLHCSFWFQRRATAPACAPPGVE